jgi:hypothetical protein
MGARRNEDNFNLHKNQSGKGVLGFEFSKSKIKPHKNTWRLLIIGPTNSGKTTIFVNSLLYFPRPIKTITYLGPTSTLEDEAPKKLEIICRKSGINYNPINVDLNEQQAIPDLEKPEVVVFDDLYKNKKIDSLVDDVFIRGRHNLQHGVYITQTPAFVPSSVRNNYTYLVLHKSNFTTDTEKKFHFVKGFLTDIDIDAERPSDFITILKDGNEIKWYSPPIIKGTGDVYKGYRNVCGPKSKIPYEPLPKKEENIVKKGIELSGNQEINDKPIYEIPQEVQSRFLTKYINGKEYKKFDFR